ncbi:hypothetical protein JX266_012230 [Neoarthrinium moseri]|nr:hypothetical protein JX266_012230 [Neoarthrinium moseri]
MDPRAGRRRNFHDSNVAKGVVAVGGRDTTGVKFVYESLFPASVLLCFSVFLKDGQLADGRKTVQPRPSEEEASYFLMPYSEWAPERFRGSIRSESVVNHSLMILSGLDNFLLGSWEIDKETHFMKSRALLGMVPISDRRWAQQRLDDPANFPRACQHIANVVNVFTYMNQEPFKSMARTSYNKIWDHIKHFETALNAKQAAEHQPHVRIMPLWDEYIKTHFDFAAARSHAWILKRVEKLQEVIVARMGAATHDLGPTSYSDEQIAIGDDMQDISEILVQADVACRISTDGFKSEWIPLNSPSLPRSNWTGYNGQTALSTAALPNDLESLKTVYGFRMRWLNRVKMMEQTMLPGPWRGGTSAPSDMMFSMQQQLEAYRDARMELRGEPAPLRMEHWVAKIKAKIDDGADQAWGFVGYRLSYRHSPEQWKNFLDAFKKDVQPWEHGSTGALWIKRLCRMRWLDGQELGIPDGDVEAARRHFETYRKSSAWINGLAPSMFLVADDSSIESYLNGGVDFLEPGNTGGFVLLTEAQPARSEDRGNRDSDFDGTVRVLGSLLWDDVYAGMSVMALTPEDLWMMARLHPLQLYIGPLSKSQKQLFRGFNWIRSHCLSTALTWTASKNV